MKISKDGKVLSVTNEIQLSAFLKSGWVKLPTTTNNSKNSSTVKKPR
jgi:hypothetical protein